MIYLPDDGRCEARLLDVGVGGMALLSRNGAPPGYLRIRFRLSPASGEFDVAGKVVRERHSRDRTVWGVQFHGLDLGTRTRLEDYVLHQARLANTP